MKKRQFLVARKWTAVPLELEHQIRQAIETLNIEARPGEYCRP
jgi:hypothetical protein